MVRNFDGAGALIEQWLKNKGAALLLGIWERISNPGFNSLKFEGINRRQNNPLRDPDRLPEEDGRHLGPDAPRLCQPFAFSKSTVGLHPGCRCPSIVNQIRPSPCFFLTSLRPLATTARLSTERTTAMAWSRCLTGIGFGQLAKLASGGAISSKPAPNPRLCVQLCMWLRQTRWKKLGPFTASSGTRA